MKRPGRENHDPRLFLPSLAGPGHLAKIHVNYYEPITPVKNRILDSVHEWCTDSQGYCEQISVLPGNHALCVEKTQGSMRSSRRRTGKICAGSCTRTGGFRYKSPRCPASHQDVRDCLPVANYLPFFDLRNNSYQVNAQCAHHHEDYTYSSIMVCWSNRSPCAGSPFHGLYPVIIEYCRHYSTGHRTGPEGTGTDNHCTYEHREPVLRSFDLVPE